MNCEHAAKMLCIGLPLSAARIYKLRDDDGLFGNSLEWLHTTYVGECRILLIKLLRDPRVRRHFSMLESVAYTSLDLFSKSQCEARRGRRGCEAAENEVKLERKLGVNPF